MSDTPSPGSPEAVALGCGCPVDDNRHGQGVPSDDGALFWVEENCPMHKEKWSTAKHYDNNRINARCTDGEQRGGHIIDMPFIGNEHRPCTLKTDHGDMYEVEMAEVIRVCGSDPRYF